LEQNDQALSIYIAKANSVVCSKLNLLGMGHDGSQGLQSTPEYVPNLKNCTVT